MELQKGYFAISKAGHDKGRAYLVCALTSEGVYLTDGKSHRIRSPKKKNPKHLQPSESGLSDRLMKRLDAGDLRDEEIIEALVLWKKQH